MGHEKMNNNNNIIHLGVLGKTLGHSLSPQIHTYLLRQQNISGTYSKYEMDENEVLHVLDVMRQDNILGMNVTIPYKELLYKMVDELEPSAQKIGAVNTILMKQGRSYGYNTDYIGAMSMFHKAGVSLKGKSVVILGSGGAAKALIYGFYLEGAAKITAAGRNEEALLCLKKAFSFLDTCSMTQIPPGDLLVNTTPVGMFPHTEESPVEASTLRKFKTASDIVYNPLMTKFLKTARQEGLETVTGLMMLVDQAIGSQEIWLHKKLDYGWGNKIHDELGLLFS